MDRIKSKSISSNELFLEIEKLDEHIAGHVGATFQNYSRKEIIDEIIKVYPERIDVEELKERTQEKINKFFFRLIELLFCEKSKISVSSSTITLILNHMKGVQNDDLGDGKPTFIIKNWIEPESQGEIIRAEPKTL